MKTLFKLPSIMLLTGLMTLQISVVSATTSVETIYHSSECSPYGNQLKGTQYSNKFRNNKSNNITIICPIPRTIPEAVPYGVYAVEVKAQIDNVAGKNFSCTLSLYERGKYVTSDYTRSTFDFVKTELTNSATRYHDGAFTLHCSIPPGGAFYDYTVVETW